MRTIRVPAPSQVRRAAMWLSCLNYQLSEDNLPIAESPFATVCTPYVFNKYRGIFGLSGSIGGQAELTYLASTYGAVKFEVPRFLDTCTGDARKVVTNHGVEVVGSEAALVARVVTLCEQWVQRVPVLVITSGPEELLKVQTAVMQSRGVVAEEVCAHADSMVATAVVAKVAAEASVAWVVEATTVAGLGETARVVVARVGAAAGASTGRVGRGSVAETAVAPVATAARTVGCRSIRHWLGVGSGLGLRVEVGVGVGVKG